MPGRVDSCKCCLGGTFLVWFRSRSMVRTNAALARPDNPIEHRLRDVVVIEPDTAERPAETLIPARFSCSDVDQLVAAEVNQILKRARRVYIQPGVRRLAKYFNDERPRPLRRITPNGVFDSVIRCFVRGRMGVV